MKIKVFGCLRMRFKSMGSDIPAFKIWLKANYTQEECKKISAAFLSIGKPDEVDSGEVLAE